MATPDLTPRAEISNIIEKIVDEKKAVGGIDRVYCLACGGSLASFYVLEYLLKNESSCIAVNSITANEFVHATPKAVGARTLAIAMSLAGNTPETVEAARLAKEKGATVIVLCAKHDVPLEKYGDYTVIYGNELEYEFDEGNQAKLLQIGFELLRLYEEYPHYNAACEGLGKIQTVCDLAVKKLQKRTAQFGEENKDEPIIYTIGSGPSYSIAYMQSICMIMEMEWIHSSSIHAGEYFHGPFEITDPETPFMIFLNDGRTRKLDERALKFLRNYAKKITIVDAKELGLSIIDDAVVEFFNPILLWCAALEYAKGLAVSKKHPLMMRRYMNKVEY